MARTQPPGLNPGQRRASGNRRKNRKIEKCDFTGWHRGALHGDARDVRGVEKCRKHNPTAGRTQQSAKTENPQNTGIRDESPTNQSRKYSQNLKARALCARALDLVSVCRLSIPKGARNPMLNSEHLAASLLENYVFFTDFRGYSWDNWGGILRVFADF